MKSNSTGGIGTVGDAKYLSPGTRSRLMVSLDDPGSNPDADTVAVSNIGRVSTERGPIAEKDNIGGSGFYTVASIKASVSIGPNCGDVKRGIGDGNDSDIRFDIAAEGGYIPVITFGVIFVDRGSTVGKNLKTTVLFGGGPIDAKRSGIGAGKAIEDCDLWKGHVSFIILLDRVNPTYFSLSAIRYKCRTGRIGWVETGDRTG